MNISKIPGLKEWLHEEPAEELVKRLRAEHSAQMEMLLQACGSTEDPKVARAHHLVMFTRHLIIALENVRNQHVED